MNMGMKIGQQLRFKMIEWSKMTTYITAYLLIGVAFTVLALALYEKGNEIEAMNQFIVLSVILWPVVVFGVMPIVVIDILKEKLCEKNRRQKK